MGPLFRKGVNGARATAADGISQLAQNRDICLAQSARTINAQTPVAIPFSRYPITATCLRNCGCPSNLIGVAAANRFRLPVFARMRRLRRRALRYYCVQTTQIADSMWTLERKSRVSTNQALHLRKVISCCFITVAVYEGSPWKLK